MSTKMVRIKNKYIYFLFCLAAADHKRKIKAKLSLSFLEILYGHIAVD